MSPLTKLRSRNKSTGGLATETVGNALVVHAPDGMSAEARSLAGTLPADPDHDLVVADPPPEAATTYWESLATSLPRGRRGLRLVLVNGSRELGALAGHWLSTRLGRTVVAPDGVQYRDQNGVLFVHAGPGTGWMRFRPGRAPERVGKRFPRPSWESPAVAEPFRAGRSTAEPLPSGLWLRPDGDKGRLDAGRNRLTHAIPCQPDVLTVVLGGRDLPELPLADVIPLWEAVPAADRPSVRFVHFGPCDGSWPELANLLGTEITCYTGMPVGADVHLLRPDGSHGWNTFAQQLTFAPHDPKPRLRTHRPPLPGLTENGPATYEYAPDVTLEVVLAGLWIRPPDVPAHAAGVRATPVDPATNLLLYEDSDPRFAGRMCTVAQEVLDRLDYSTRLASRLVATTTVCPPRTPDDVLLPWLTELLDTASLPHPKQALPRRPAPATPEELAESRAWVRANCPEFAEQADPVRAVLAAHPKLGAGEDAVADAVALRLFLAGREPDVHLGRCALAALAALPAHRGGTVARLTPTPAQWDLYRRQQVLVEQGFLTMLTTPCAEGGTDVFVWSMTGRKTAWLEEDAVDGRVVFAPGTCFKVLAVDERILLRELSSTEIGPDGTVDENRRSLDQLATTSLLRYAEKLAVVEQNVPAGLFRLPGVTDD